MSSRLYSSPRTRSQELGYVFVFIALVASVIALIFGCIGAYAVYVSLAFHPDGSIGDVRSIDALPFPVNLQVIGIRVALVVLEVFAIRVSAVLYPVLALIAATVAWLFWRAAKRRLKGLL